MFDRVCVCVCAFPCHRSAWNYVRTTSIDFDMGKVKSVNAYYRPPVCGAISGDCRQYTARYNRLSPLTIVEHHNVVAHRTQNETEKKTDYLLNKLRRYVFTFSTVSQLSYRQVMWCMLGVVAAERSATPNIEFWVIFFLLSKPTVSD